MTYGREQAEHLGGYGLGGDPDSWAPEAWLGLLAIVYPRSIVDIGAGEGYAAEWFHTNTAAEVLAVDGGENAIRRCAEGVGPNNVLMHDYTTGPLNLGRDYDLGWSCEFVEHVEERFAPNFLATFRCCRWVAMTHAIPGQSGYHHVNCRWPDYWTGAMAAIGFVHCVEQSLKLRALITKDGNYVKNTLMLFRRNDG